MIKKYKREEREESEIKQPYDYTIDYIRWLGQKNSEENLKLKNNKDVDSKTRRMPGLENIVGKKIISFEVSECKTEITFVDDEGTSYIYYAEADCCSSSWIEYIDEPDNLICETVLKVDVNESERLEHEKDWDGDEKLDCMGYDIYTKKGVCKIEFRNSSNGYYSGSLKIREIRFKGK